MKTEKPFEPGSRQSGRRAKDEETDYVVGIDTGGTYTDGVLLDYRSRKVLASGKTLTTRENLADGVVTVLEMLNIRNPSRVKLVGISSTLATNSIAEGKGREVGLILIGYDRDLVSSFGLTDKFSTPCFEFFSGGHTAQGVEREPLDIDAIRKWVADHKDRVDSFAISSYFSPLNPAHEEAVFQAVREICDRPVVLGHQLSTALDSVKRAATASLNASLVAIMQEFIQAVQVSLSAQRINAPLMIVRGDGSLMPYTEAAEKPVETILSGPAASAIGGLFFSDHANALMIDVGGTTTDMAFIREGRVTVSDEGARVGRIETAVRAARIRTACVGCDSRISFDQNGKPEVGPDRVVPLCRLAALYPGVKDTIIATGRKNPEAWKPADLDFLFLHKPVDIAKAGISDPRQIAVMDLLNRGPQSLAQLLKHAGVHHAVQLNADGLIRQGLIETATLTPTDLLHINGQMDVWDAEAARTAAKIACSVFGLDTKTFVADILDLIVALMVQETIVFLGRQEGGSTLPENVDGKWGRWLVNEAICRNDECLAVNITSRFPIIGIGAPASIFVKRVAEVLKAPFVLPKHAGVANAAGAVAGSVVSEKEAILYARESETAQAFVVQIDDERMDFPKYDAAMAYAEKQVGHQARKRAEAAGASSPQITIRVTTEGSIERVRARAVGNPRLSA